MSDLHVGIIGVGRFGARHAKNLSGMSGVKVTGIVDQIEERSRTLAGEYGARWHTDYRGLLDQQDVDAVVVALPHKFLASVSIAAAEAGKHILCQKPMALNSAEGEQVVAAAAKAGVKLMVYGQNRFRTDVRAAREALQGGEIGDFYLLEEARKFLGFTAGYPAWFKSVELTGGGVLQNFTCHSLDVLRWVLGQEITAVSAMIGRYYFDDVEGEDNAVLLLRFANGAIGSSVQSWSTNGNWIEVTGGKGRMRIADNAVYLSKGPNADWKEIARRDPAEDERYMLEEHFVKVLRGDAPASPSGEEYLGVIRAVEAAYVSAQQGREVKTAEL